MSWVHVETDLTTWFIEGTFIASVVFTIIYGTMFYWRDSFAGRNIFILGLCIAGALLHSTLLAWHLTSLSIKVSSSGQVVEHMDLFGDCLSWLAVASLLGAMLALLGLAGQSVYAGVTGDIENLTPFGRRALHRN